MAPNEVEQNLKSYQYQGQMYYWTYKPIQPGTELLEFYGYAYAKYLGIDMDQYYSEDTSSPISDDPPDFGSLRISK